MKFRLRHNTLPNVNSIVLLCGNETDTIGIVEFVLKDKFILLELDKNGRIEVGMYDNWIVLNINDIQSLRVAYVSYINRNINDLIGNSYRNFASKYIKNE